MTSHPTALGDGALLADQIAYYRARAGEYDEWWLRQGRFDHGAELNAAGHADAATVQYRIVKGFYEPDVLNDALAGLGWRSDVAQAGRYFIHGAAHPARGESR